MEHASRARSFRAGLFHAVLPTAAALLLSATPRPSAAPVTPGTQFLTAADVAAVVQSGAEAVVGEQLSIAVVDRRGGLLALWRRGGAAAAEDELALALARTGAFFGHNQAPLTSRTIRYISGIHFPPGVRNQPNGPLYGIENTNRVSRQVAYNPGKEYPEPLNVDGAGPSLGIATGKRDVMDSDEHAVNPGGQPLYKNGDQVGGVGVAGVSPADAEYAASRAGGTFGFSQPYAGSGFVKPSNQDLYVEGFRLPLIDRDNVAAPRAPGVFPGTGSFRIGPAAGAPAPDGFIVGPMPTPRPEAELSAGDVRTILEQSVATASRTRAAIRLPIGSRCKMAMAVSDLDGNILGVFRMPDSTTFSLDVAIAKARNLAYFSSPARNPADLPGLPAGAAVSNRTINFGSQPLFPAGINSTRPGPFFNLYVFDAEHPGTQGMDARPGPKNGVVFFPGSIPLYRGGKLIGGLGISGDGVEQDDFVAFHGAKGFRPPPRLRSDRHRIRGVRMPFLKFPRNPLK